MNCPIKDRIVAGYAKASPSDKVAIAGVALAAAKFAPVSTFGGQVAVAGAVAIGALLWFGGRACCAGCADAAAGAVGEVAVGAVDPVGEGGKLGGAPISDVAILSSFAPAAVRARYVGGCVGCAS